LPRSARNYDSIGQKTYSRHYSNGLANICLPVSSQVQIVESQHTTIKCTGTHIYKSEQVI